jgi:poly(3-hydroxybutyrate) depolymerase
MAEGAYICYDDKDTYSIEYGLIEKMLQEVGEKFCYDQHKVFVQGHSSGGWYSNMMGCVYGSTLIRAMSSNGGGIAQGDGETPPCTENPIPGMWILPQSDGEGRTETAIALDHALTVNQCEGGGVEGAWENAPSQPYTEGGAQNCRKYMCPEAFPVIYCSPPGGHGPVSWHDDAGWAFFNSLP